MADKGACRSAYRGVRETGRSLSDLIVVITLLCASIVPAGKSVLCDFAQDAAVVYQHK
jgi:hypothetical protein